MKCRPLRWLWGLLPIAAFSGLAALGIQSQVERDLTQRVTEVLEANNLGWADIAFNGRDGVLSGRANEDDEPSKALRLGNNVYGVRILDGQADLLRKIDPYLWSAALSDNKVTLTGFVPNATVRKSVLAAAKAQFPRSEIVDQLDFARGSPPAREWTDGVKFGLRQLAQLRQGSFDLKGLDVSLAGEAASSAAYKDVKAALAGVPKPLTLASDKVKAPFVSPYAWAARLAGNSLVLTGYVPNERLRDSILAHAKQVFGKTSIVDRMETGEGAPNGWDKAVRVTLDQLATLQEGTGELKGGQLSLSGLAADEAAADATRRAFKSQIPEAYRAAEAITAPKPSSTAISPYETKISASAAAVDLTGYVPNESARAGIIAAVKQRLPGRTINDRLVIGSGEPVNYDACLLQALGGLGRLGTGRLQLTDGRVELTGQTDNEVLAQSLPGDVRTAVRGACETRVNVAYDDSAKRRADAARAAEIAAQQRAEAERDVAEQKRLEAEAQAKRDAVMTREREKASACEGELRSARNAGIIQFERASDVLLRQSMPTLRQLTEIALKCENVLIEIEGHTDSEGIPERNQPLSERRAQSVVDYLVDHGVSAERIRAVGYGDTRPIAPNDTAENRAKNRRIEFTVKTK